MDNRLFNVNGKGHEMLRDTLRLAFTQEGCSNAGCSSWTQTKEHGLILLWCDEDSAHKFPARLTSDECLPFVLAWLKGDDAKNVELGQWEGGVDHDGSNGEGWRVYCEDWGHVNGMYQAICAIKPCVLWYGK